MSYQEICGIVFLSFILLLATIITIFQIREFLKQDNIPKHFVFIQRMGNCSIYYCKRTNCVYSVTKDGEIKIIHERFVGFID